MKTEQRNTQIIFEYDTDMKKKYLHRIIGNEKKGYFCERREGIVCNSGGDVIKKYY